MQKNKKTSKSNNGQRKTIMAKKNKATKPMSIVTEEALLDFDLDYNELSTKLEKLESLLEDESIADECGQTYTNMLISQVNAMEEYRDTLAINIAYLRRMLDKDKFSNKKCN